MSEETTTPESTPASQAAITTDPQLKPRSNWLWPILTALVVLVAAACALFFWPGYLNSKPVAQKVDTQPTPTPSFAKTKVLAEGLMANIPAGWNGEGLHRTIGDQSYQMRFQLEKTDFLTTGQHSSNNVLVEKTKLKSGQDAYIIKNYDATLALSACPLKDDMGCSFKYQEKYLIASLTGAYQPGDQAVRNIDFKSPYTAEAVKDFKAMIEALEL